MFGWMAVGFFSHHIAALLLHIAGGLCNVVWCLMWVLWRDVVVLQVSPPFETAEFDIMYGDGINALGCVFDVAKDLDVFEARVSGGWAGGPWQRAEHGCQQRNVALMLLCQGSSGACLEASDVH